MNDQPGAVIILEGFEYLTTVNGPRRTEFFLKDLLNSAREAGALVLVPLTQDVYIGDELDHFRSLFDEVVE